jgi:acyl-CoA synthetase (AMP-forming)/AMP-acid ligase II
VISPDPSHGEGAPGPASFALADLFEGVSDALPTAEALVCGAGGRIISRLTFAELDERANRVGNGLAARGVVAGDRVGLHLRNHAEHVEAILGAFKLRAVPVNVNFRYTPEELAHLVADSEMAALLTEPDLADAAREGARLAGRPDLVIVERGDDLERMLADASSARPLVGERSDDDLYVLYTGGTTGSPKGVMWRQRDIYMASFGGRGAPSRGVPPVEEPLDVVSRARAGAPVMRRMPLCPLMHGAAAWVAWQSLLAGGAVVLDTDLHLDAAASLRLAEESEADLIMVVGDAVARPLADALAAARVADPAVLPLPALQLVASGGAILSPAVKADLRALLPHVTVLDSFGSSETGSQGRLAPAEGGGPPRLVSDAGTTVVDDVFRPVPADGETIGKLAQRGHVPIGYWGDPERTARTFPVVDGVRWAVSGDDAVIEPDGSIRVLGRGSASINTGGEKVFPEEVEGVLKGHPAVFDALVVGVPDDRFGQRVSAVVAVRDARAAPAVRELVDHARAHVAGYKVPRSWVLTDAVVRSASGKPDYRWARDVVLASEADAAAPARPDDQRS